MKVSASPDLMAAMSIGRHFAPTAMAVLAASAPAPGWPRIPQEAGVDASSIVGLALRRFWWWLTYAIYHEAHFLGFRGDWPSGFDWECPAPFGGEAPHSLRRRAATPPPVLEPIAAFPVGRGRRSSPEQVSGKAAPPPCTNSLPARRVHAPVRVVVDGSCTARCGRTDGRRASEDPSAILVVAKASRSLRSIGGPACRAARCGPELGGGSFAPDGCLTRRICCRCPTRWSRWPQGVDGFEHVAGWLAIACELPHRATPRNAERPPSAASRSCLLARPSA